jgi:hypothetical protein
LAAFDATLLAVWRAAWAVAALVTTLTPAGALRVLGFAHPLARRERG